MRSGHIISIWTLCFGLIIYFCWSVSDNTLLDVGDTALVFAVVLLLGFFFLILMPGTGAEFRASRNPVHSMAAEEEG